MLVEADHEEVRPCCMRVVRPCSSAQPGDQRSGQWMGSATMAAAADVLVLHGSPGSGKSTLARTVSEALGAADVAHGVIDMDELSLVHPYLGHPFARANLRAIWPNHVAAIPNIKLIIPMVFEDEQEVGLLRAALPGAGLTICEAAPIAVLKQE